MNRSELVEDLVFYIKSAVSEFRLVKAYEGELRSGGERFLAEVRGLLPCALVVCEKVEPDSSSSDDVKITIDIIIAEKDFTGQDHIPAIYALSDKLIQAVNCYKPDLKDTFDWYEFGGDKHVAHNDFFTIYSQRYTIMQRLQDCCQVNH